MAEEELRDWRHLLHSRPELAFEEKETARFVAERLRAFGIPVVEGIGVTGVVGVIEGDRPGKAIALRADMDGLPILEKNAVPYVSRNEGKMHACGHDGHTTMLLGAARELARTRSFAGRVVLIFQPAEENEGGARRMMQDGLFERFPVEAVFGMHNRPGLDVGRFAVRAGPMMASFDVFEIAIRGVGTHAARPHLGADPIVAAGHIITSIQSIVSRTIDPVQSAVVSITQVSAGSTWNVIPETATLKGTVRALRPELQDEIEGRFKRLVERTAEAHGCEAVVTYDRRYPVLVNTGSYAELCADIAEAVAGNGKVVATADPAMGSEDFAFMLQAKPGCYIWIGNGPVDGGRVLHSPHYDFNDAAIPLGVAYWLKLVERILA